MWWSKGRLDISSWLCEHTTPLQHLTLVRPPVGQSWLVRGGVAVLTVTHGLHPWELSLGCLMGRCNRKPWVKWFWWSPQALISHTWGQSCFFWPFLHILSASSEKLLALCTYRAKWSLLQDETTDAFERFSRSVPRVCLCRCSCPDPVYTPTDPFFPLHSFEMKDVNWERGSEYLEKTVLPITPWYNPGYREESLLSVSSFFYKASFFFLCVTVWSVTLAKSQI